MREPEALKECSSSLPADGEEAVCTAQDTCLQQQPPAARQTAMDCLRGAVRYHVDITAAHNPTDGWLLSLPLTDGLTTGEVFENAMANEAHYQGPNGVSPVTVPYVCNNRRAAGPLSATIEL